MTPTPASAEHVPQVRAVALTGYVQLARSAGLDPGEMLRDAGIDPDDLADPERRIPAAAAISLLEESARRSGDAAFALRLSEGRTLASIGPLGLLLRHEPTVRASLQRLIQYRRLLGDVTDWSMEEQDGEAVIRMEIPAPLRQRQATELVMALAAIFVAEAVGGGWHPTITCFRHDPPPDLSLHRRIFRGDLRFDAECDGFICDSESLDRPNAFADADFARYAKDYADRLARELPEPLLVDQVRAIIRPLLPLGEAGLDRVAAKLKMHSRSLQRRLAAEGTPFHDLLDEMREELARDHLAHRELPVTEIAHLLGYSSPTSFTRWFTRRCGISPSQWRASQAHPAPPGQ